MNDLLISVPVRNTVIRRSSEVEMGREKHEYQRVSLLKRAHQDPLG